MLAMPKLKARMFLQKGIEHAVQHGSSSLMMHKQIVCWGRCFTITRYHKALYCLPVTTFFAAGV